MQRLVIAATFAIAMVLAAGFGSAQDDNYQASSGWHYWARGKAYSLSLDLRLVAVSIAKGEPINSTVQKIRTLLGTIGEVAKVYKRYRVALIEFRHKLDEIEYFAWLNRLRRVDGVWTAQPVFWRGNKFRMIPTGELLFRLQPWVGLKQRQAFEKEYSLQVFKRFWFAHNAFAAFVNRADLVVDVADKLVADPRVLWAQPEFIHPVERKYDPNDPDFVRQWHLHNTGQNGAVAGNDAGVYEAWQTTTGSPDVIIAVVDDGVELMHPDLQRNVLSDVGYDFVDQDNDPSPGDWDAHGTCVAGVAAAVGNNSEGGLGACPDCRILPIRLLGSEITSQDEANALALAANQGAWVINNSWGVPDGNSESVPIPELVREAVDYAVNYGRNGLGSLVTFAAGNGDEPVATDGYPAYELTLAIAASTDQGVRADYSDYGPEVEVNAPSSGGVNGIYTTDNLGYSGYDYGDYTADFGGTSSATPLASGVYALVMSVRPDLSWYQIRQIVRDSAEKIDQPRGRYDENGHSDYYGYGRVDAEAAVALAQEYDDGCTPQPEECNNQDDDCDGMIDEGWVCYPCQAQDEECNGLDDDCDGLVDEDGACNGVRKGVCMPCRSASECESGNCSYISQYDYLYFCLQSCRNGEQCPQGFHCDGWDCIPDNRDCDLTRCQMQEEICNGRDDNCNGEIDEGNVCCTPTDPPDEVCDGVDNDCNGEIDDVPPEQAPPDLVCLTKGVCAEGGPRCVNGEWRCVYPDTYEEEETLCDGLDNDCDGETDEELPPPEGLCRTEGICRELHEAVCENGEWHCIYPEGFEEEEQTCDRLDNDCDGLTDENLEPPEGLCPQDAVGVCKDAYPSCTARGWRCIMPPEYEEEETLCDGLDNDCDGETDEPPACVNDGDEETTEAEPEPEPLEIEQAEPEEVRHGKEAGAYEGGCGGCTGGTAQLDQWILVVLAVWRILRRREKRG